MTKKTILLTGFFLNLTLTPYAAASGHFETWSTQAVCSEKKFVIESHCKASNKEFELNECSADQTLSNGEKKIRIPSAKPSKGTRLFAYAWNCSKFQNTPYLMIYYSAGSGRTEADELEEAYSLDLEKVHSEKLQVNIFRAKKEGAKGLIRSIYPD